MRSIANSDVWQREKREDENISFGLPRYICCLMIGMHVTTTNHQLCHLNWRVARISVLGCSSVINSSHLQPHAAMAGMGFVSV